MVQDGAALSTDERAALGKGVRTRVPRTSLAEWDAGRRREQPLDLLAQQAATRVPELVPIRHGRMATSPFTFFRGSALQMASDLAQTGSTDLVVQLCGDAHLLNFGGFASPERAVLFDANDFDETLPGPFEWDVKRLAASVEVAGRTMELDSAILTRIVQGAVRTYREAMRSFATQGRLSIWYTRLDAATIAQRWGAMASAAMRRRALKAVDRGKSKDALRARDRLTRTVGGELRFISDPPLLTPISELIGETGDPGLAAVIEGAIRSYRRSLSGERRHLLAGYRFVDLARKIVGVGSVGTRDWVALFVGRDDADVLVLQVKEAEPSVLERYLPKSVFSSAGQRVVEGQRLMQAASDLFLGWQRTPVGADARAHDYYVRQLWDWKISADVDVMQASGLSVYSQMCAWTLARAHARSGDAVTIAAYLGSGDAFDRALAEFARRYADQNEVDFAALTDAIAHGKIAAERGV